MPGGVLGRGYVRSFATSVKLDPEVIVTEFVAQFPDSPVTHGYPPAEREAAEKVADTGTAGHSTWIRLNESGNWTRVASVVVLVIVLAGVMTFAAPRQWAQWDTLRSWATSVSVPANPLADFMSAETPIKTLDARPLKPLHTSGPRSLPSTRALPPTIVAVNASPVPVATASKSAPIAPAQLQLQLQLLPLLQLLLTPARSRTSL